MNAFVGCVGSNAAIDQHLEFADPLVGMQGLILHNWHADSGVCAALHLTLSNIYSGPGGRSVGGVFRAGPIDLKP